MCGFSKTFKYVDGKNYKVESSSQTKHNDIKMLKGIGIPNIKSGERGDLVVQFNVVYPTPEKLQLIGIDDIKKMFNGGDVGNVDDIDNTPIQMNDFEPTKQQQQECRVQ